MQSARRHLTIAAAVLLTCGLPLAAQAQAAWPQAGPVKLIVPFAAGGPADNLARVIAEKLQARIGQVVIIENLGGAGASLGTKKVAQSPPDGYTFGYATSASHVISPFLYEKFPYDAQKDFAPVSLVAEHVNVLVVGAGSKITSVADLLAQAKANPGKLNFGSAGVGSTNHLSAELLMKASGTRMTHVPYKGSGPALIDLVAGNIDFMFDVPVTALPLVQAGKLRAIATTLGANKRHPSVPDLPTIGQAVPGYEVVGWTAFVAPAHTPAEIVAKMNRELATVLNDPATKAQFVKLGFDTVPSTPEQLAARIKADQALWGPVIKGAGLKAE